MNPFKDFSAKKNGEVYERFLQNGISKKYEVSYTSPSQIDQENIIEIWQNLIDLGYLEYTNIKVLQDVDLEDINLLKKYLKKYLREDSILCDRFGWTNYHINHDGIIDDFLRIIMRRLNVHTSLEQELEFSKPLKTGERNLYSRILHHRLRSFNQYDSNISAPLNKETVIRSYKVLLITGEINRAEYDSLDFNSIPSKVFNYLGDIKNLLLDTIDSYKYDMLIYHKKNDSKIPFENVYIHRNEIISSSDSKDFKRQTNRKGIVFSTLKKHIRSRGSAWNISFNERNQFILAVLQVFLWMKSYYRDRVDVIWGKECEKAFREFWEFERIHGDNILLSIKDNFNLINLVALKSKLSSLLKKDHSHKEKETLIENFFAKQQRTQEANNKEFEKVKKKAKGLRKLWNGIKKTGAKVYNGVKEAINSSINWLQNVGNWLNDKIFGPAFTFFRNIIQKVKYAIGVFFTGFKRMMHFIFRKPVLTYSQSAKNDDKFVLTKFALDSDAFVYVNGLRDYNIIQEHQNTINKLRANLQLFVRIVLEVIEILRNGLTPPIGWIKIGLKIFSLVRDVCKGDFAFNFSY